MEELRESREAEREKVKAQFGESYAKVQEFAIRKIINAKDDVAVLDQGKSLLFNHFSTFFSRAVSSNRQILGPNRPFLPLRNQPNPNS